MADLVFDWDRKKASENLRKHGVSFEEAKYAFLDENARLIPDPEHSSDEDRFVLLGLSLRLRLLVVVHCYRDNDHVVRIISARKSNRQEQNQYSDLLR